MMPSKMEEYDGYHLQRNDTTENISGWIFDENINYFHDIMGNYTLTMRQVADDGTESLEMNSTFAFVSNKEGYNSIIMDFFSEGDVIDFGCQLPPEYTETDNGHNDHDE